MHYRSSLFLLTLLPAIASAQQSSLTTHKLPSGRVEMYAKTTASAQQQLMGYTDAPVPEGVEMPEALQDWIQTVDRATRYANAHPEALFGADALAQAPHVTTSVSPLLGSIEWDQSSPYNMYCPDGDPVGCVATAMVQVMYYWKWPAQGSGERTWNYNGHTYYVNFGEETYDWDLMYPKHNSSCTEEQNQEVAKLCYDAGISIDMMYGAGGSGTWTQLIPSALRTYFNYNSNCECVTRDEYTYADWISTLNAELEAGRPIIYSGSGDGGGHAFVVDGVNSNGYYHLNWGWDGYYNGWYDICILNPGGSGTGAGISTYGFSASQSAVLYCTPEQGIGQQLSPMRTTYVYLDRADNYFWMSGYYENMSGLNAYGYGGFSLRNDSTGEVTNYIDSTLLSFSNLYRGQWYNWLSYPIHPDTLANGTYHAWLSYLAQGDSVVTRVRVPLFEGNAEFAFSVDSGRLVDLQSSNADFPLEVGEFSHQEDTISAGRPTQVYFPITNNGNERFIAQYTLKLTDANGNRRDVSTDAIWGDLQPGETKNITFTAELPEGDYTGKLRFYNHNLEISGDLIENISLHVVWNENSPASLYLTEQPTLLTEHCEVDGEITFRFVLNNEGGNYTDRLMMKFFENTRSTDKAALTIGDEADVQMMTEGDTLIVTGVLSGLRGMKKYYARPYWRNVHNQDIALQYQTADSTLKNCNPIEVRVYNATGIEQIENDADDTNVPTYDLMGRRSNAGHLLIRRRKIIVQ